MAFKAWNADHPATAGLRAKDFKLEKASVFAADADEQIGEVDAGPGDRGARRASPRRGASVSIPALSAMRYELATPLLFANLLRWLSPEIFRRWEISGGSVGTIRQPMDEDMPESDIRVVTEDGTALPFTLRDRTLDFFSGTPGLVRVAAGDREYVYSLTLPQLWDTQWEPPAGTRARHPAICAVRSIVRAISGRCWRSLGAAGLLAEWLLFGRGRRPRVRRLLTFLGIRERGRAIPAEVRR